MPGRNLIDPTTVAASQSDPGLTLKAPTFENIEIPEEFGPVEIVVDELKVKRFAFTQDDFGEWYLRTGPDGVRIGQPGLLSNDLLQLFTTRYDASRVVGLHTSEELWFDHPVVIGTTVSLSGCYVEKFERRGQGHVVMEAEARDEEGRVLVRHRGVEIMRTAPASVAGRGSAGASSGPRVTAEYDQTLPRVEKLNPTVLPGTGLVPLHKSVTFEQMAVFSRLGEFVRNIHNDLLTARSAGLDAPIIQGQQQVCYLAELMARSFGFRWFSSGWLKVKFLRPVEALSELDVAGVVRGVEESPSGTVVHLNLWIQHQGRLVTIGWASGTLARQLDYGSA